MTLNTRIPLRRVIRQLDDDALERELRSRLFTWNRPRDSFSRDRFVYVTRLVIEAAKERGIRV